MFGTSGFLTLQPFSHTWEEFPLTGRGPGSLLDRWTEMLDPWSSEVLVNGSSPGSRPRVACCHHACARQRPQRCCRQHFLILPTLPSHGEGGDQKNEKAATSCKQCAGRHTAGTEQTATAGSKQAASASNSKDAAESSSNGKAPEKCPWQFSVDMKGCHEVRATTEGGMLMVEGRGSSDTSQQTVRYLTSLPHHVNHDALTATLSNGRLTVTQRAGAQLEGQARTLPIEVQKEASPQPEKQQQQQQPQPNTEVSEEKDKTTSSPDAQEEEQS